MNNKRLWWTDLLLLVAVGVMLLVACTPSAEGAHGDGPALPAATAPGSESAATDSLVPIEVTHVQVEVGVGSPIPVNIQVAGTWPGLCAQLATVEQQVADYQFDISLLAHPGDPDCPPDFLGLPFSLAVPINIVELPEGSYTVTVNGIIATFDAPVTP